MLGEEPVVCKENESYVVLEGNRRMAALKILLSPRKYLSSIRATTIERANFQIEKIDCHVAPTRIAANRLIYRRHNGIPVKRWDKINQDAYLNNLISIEHLNIDEINKELGVPPSEIRKSLRRFNAHQLAIKLFHSYPYELQQIAQTDFPITNLERFYDNEKGAKFIGISFTATGKVKRHIPQKDFNERFMFIVREILNDRLNSRIFNGDKEKEDYFKYLSEKFSLVPANFEESGFIDDDKPDVSEPQSESQPQPKGKGTNQSVSNIKLFGEADWHTDIYRIDALFMSLQKINHKSHLDMVAISFRCYLDMIVYQYLRKKNLIQNVCEIENVEINKENNKKYDKARKYILTKYAISEDEIVETDLRGILNLFEKRDVNYAPNLSKMLKYIASTPELLSDPRQREALSHFLTPSNPLINIKSLNLLIHNEYQSISVEELKKTALFLLPLLQHINSELKNAE